MFAKYVVTRADPVLSSRRFLLHGKKYCLRLSGKILLQISPLLDTHTLTMGYILSVFFLFTKPRERFIREHKPGTFRVFQLGNGDARETATGTQGSAHHED